MPIGRSLDILDSLLNARDLLVDRGAILRNALSAARGGIDFADAVIAELGSAARCAHTVTLDRWASHHRAMRLLGSPPA